MSVKQLSVFAENKVGALYEITDILARGGVNISAFSVAETDSFGVLRLIVNHPHTAALLLSNEGKVLSVTDVVGVEVPDTEGGLSKLLKIITDNSIDVSYLYAFAVSATGNGKAHVVMRVDDNDAVEKLLSDNGYTILTDDMLRQS